MPLTPGRFSAHCMPLRIARRKPRGWKLLGDALGDQLRVGLGVLHLEDVELDLLAGELLEVGADALGLGATAADHDARTGGVDVDANAVTGALDLDLANRRAPCPSEVADRDVFLDVVAAYCLSANQRHLVGGDAQAEPVRVYFLTHYGFFPSSSVSGRRRGSRPRW